MWKNKNKRWATEEAIPSGNFQKKNWAYMKLAQVSQLIFLFFQPVDKQTFLVDKHELTMGQSFGVSNFFLFDVFGPTSRTSILFHKQIVK